MRRIHGFFFSGQPVESYQSVVPIRSLTLPPTWVTIAVSKAASSTTTRRRQDEITEDAFFSNCDYRVVGWLQGTARADTYTSADRYPRAGGSDAGATHGYATVRDPLSGAAHVYTSAGDSLSGATHAYASTGDSLSQRVGVGRCGCRIKSSYWDCFSSWQLSAVAVS